MPSSSRSPAADPSSPEKPDKAPPVRGKGCGRRVSATDGPFPISPAWPPHLCRRAPRLRRQRCRPTALNGSSSSDVRSLSMFGRLTIFPLGPGSRDTAEGIARRFAARLQEQPGHRSTTLLLHREQRRVGLVHPLGHPGTGRGGYRHGPQRRRGRTPRPAPRTSDHDIARRLVPRHPHAIALNDPESTPRPRDNYRLGGAVPWVSQSIRPMVASS